VCVTTAPADGIDEWTEQGRVRPRDHEALAATDEHADQRLDDLDVYGSFFDEPDDDPGAPPEPAGAPASGRGGESRAERTRRLHRRRNRRLVGVLVTILLVLVVGVGWFAVRPIWHYFHPSNYSGAGYGSVQVVVHANDTASDIATTLYDDGVVASTRAFTDAANNNPASTGIQPGMYVLHHKMSATAALNLLLSPSARVNSDLVIPEGATIVDVERRLTAPRCTTHVAPGTVCGLGLSKAKVVAALDHVGALGLPTDYTDGGKTPPSAEGFLFPATYPFDDTTSASDALGQMISTFTDNVRQTNFTASARALHITPYQELIIASIAQAEAKFPQDMPKVARVILNRLAAKRPLQIDATSAYADKLHGLDPTKTIYSEVKGPYNTYRNAGLPPTPISNPGVAALNAAAHPARGNWLYYVNDDAAGHLGFFHSESAFSRAVKTCQAKGWCQ